MDKQYLISKEELLDFIYEEPLSEAEVNEFLKDKQPVEILPNDDVKIKQLEKEVERLKEIRETYEGIIGEEWGEDSYLIEKDCYDKEGNIINE